MRTWILILFLTGFSSARAQDYQAILDSLDKRITEDRISDSLRAKLLYNMSWYSYYLKKPISQITDPARQSFGISTELGLDTLAFNSAKMLSIVYSDHSNYDSAFSTANRGILYLHDSKLNIAPLHMIAANALTSLNKHNEALLFNKQARTLFELQKDTTGIILLSNSEGQLYTSLGRYDMAFKLLYNAIEDAEKYRPELVASLYNSLSITYGQIGDDEKAKAGLMECIYWAKKTGNEKPLANAYNNMAIRLREDTPDSAFHYYALALEIFEHLGLDFLQKRVILNVCQLHINLEHYETARNMLKTVEEDVSKPLAPQYYYCKAQLARADKRYQESLDLAHKGLSFIDKTEENQQDLYYLVYELNKLYIGDLTAALEAYEQYTKLAEKDWENTQALAQQKTLVDHTLLNNDRDASPNTEELPQTQNETDKQGLFWALSIPLLLILVLFVWLIFNKRKQKALEVKYGNLEKEINQFSLEASKNATFLEALKKELVQAKQLPSNEVAPHINSILSSVDQYTRSDKERKDFQDSIKDIPSSFFATLNKQAKLTPSEQKLAALLKLQLSSKEIAVIMNISEKSVETYRSKLRKKLKIEKTTPLTVYFSNI